MPDVFVLDSCSLIGYLRKETGSLKVVNLLQQSLDGQATIFLHKLTATEVLYDSLRFDKTKAPDQVLSDVYRLPIIIVDELSDNLVKIAARFKITYKISFADCFVLALAILHDAVVVSADHHEFDAIEKSGELSFKWIR